MVNSSSETECDVLCVGEALLDLYPGGGGRLDAALRFESRPGGGAVNTAMALRQLGRQAALCAAVGDDPLGRGLVERIGKEGVNAALMRASPTLRTGLLFAGALGKEGGAQYLSYRTPQDEGRLLARMLPEQLHARALHLSGLLPISSHLRAFRKAFRIAEARGSFALLDINARPRFWNRPDMHAIALLARSYWVKASQGDLDAIRTTAEALRSRMWTDAVLIVTQGSSPVSVHGHFGVLSCAVEAVAGADALSASGAGDAFCAGVLDFVLGHPHIGREGSEGQAALTAISRDADFVRGAVERGIDVARAYVAARKKAISS